MSRARNFALELREKRSEAAKKGAEARALAGPRVTRKMRAALDAMARGLDRDAAAAEAKMHPRVLARNLNLPHIRALLTDRVQALIEGDAPRAAKRISELSQSAASEYVSLAASQDTLNRAGIRRPDPHAPRPGAGIQIVFQVGSYPGDTPEKVEARRQKLIEWQRSSNGALITDAEPEPVPASQPLHEED